MTNITTRATAATGATVKGAPLTNAEIDANLIALNAGKVEVDENTQALSELLWHLAYSVNFATLTWNELLRYVGVYTTKFAALDAQNSTQATENTAIEAWISQLAAGVLGAIEIAGLTGSLAASCARLVSAPASASAAGTKGEFAYDSSYIYVCTANNTWKRAALSTW